MPDGSTSRASVAVNKSGAAIALFGLLQKIEASLIAVLFLHCGMIRYEQKIYCTDNARKGLSGIAFAGLVRSRIGMAVMLTAALLMPAGLMRAQSDSLSHYLEFGAMHNAGLQSAFALMQAAMQKLPQAGALNDPQLEIGFFLQPMTLVEGRQAAELKLMQMFPWFGTRKAARTEAQHMANMAYQQFREARDNLWLEISTRWYTLCKLKLSLRYRREQRDLLLKLEALALRRMEAAAGASNTGSATAPAQMPNTAQAPAASPAGGMSGMSGMGGGAGTAQPAAPQASMSGMSGGGAGAGMTEVLNIRMELAETEFALESLESELAAETAAFNLLINSPQELRIGLPDSVGLAALQWNEADMPALIRQNNPMLLMADEEAKAYKAKEEMDRLMGLPMFGIGLQYMLINRLPEAEPMDMEAGAAMNSMNGKDMLMPMLSVSIPIFRNKYKARMHEDRYMRQAALARLDDTFSLLTAELGRYRHKLSDAARRISLYQKQSSLAETAGNLAAQSFASGAGSLAEAIRSQSRLLDYRLKSIEAIADYNITVANINKLISDNETD